MSIHNTESLINKPQESKTEGRRKSYASAEIDGEIDETDLNADVQDYGEAKDDQGKDTDFDVIYYDEKKLKGKSKKSVRTDDGKYVQKYPEWGGEEDLDESYGSFDSIETIYQPGEQDFFIYIGAAEAYREEYQESSSSESIESTPPLKTELLETEEDTMKRKEREQQIEILKQKLMDRFLLRRRNSFLHKKLVEHFRRRKMEYAITDETKENKEAEHKYLKRLRAYKDFKAYQESEIEDLNNLMEKYKSNIINLEQELQESIKIFVTRAKEVSIGLISSKTGKRLEEREVDRLLRRQIRKSEENGKKKLQFIRLKNLIEEKEFQLRNMEVFGNGLHIIDYEQMKIDNQNFTDKIEEKEEELTKMRLKTQSIMQNLAHTKEKSFASEGDIELMEEKVFEIEENFVETRERLTKARKKRDSLREEFSRLKSVSGLLSKDALLRDFESSIYEAKALAKHIEKLKKVIKDKKKQANELSKITSGKIVTSKFIMGTW